MINHKKDLYAYCRNLFHGTNKNSHFMLLVWWQKDCGRTSLSQPGEGKGEEDEEGRRRKQWQEKQGHTRAEVKIVCKLVLVMCCDSSS